MKLRNIKSWQSWYKWWNGKLVWNLLPIKFIEPEREKLFHMIIDPKFLLALTWKYVLVSWTPSRNGLITWNMLIIYFSQRSLGKLLWIFFFAKISKNTLPKMIKHINSSSWQFSSKGFSQPKPAKKFPELTILNKISHEREFVWIIFAIMNSKRWKPQKIPHFVRKYWIWMLATCADVQVA